MHHKVEVVGDHPFAFSGARAAMSADAFFAQHTLHFAQQGLQVGRTIAGGNDVEIGHFGKPRHIEYNNVLALFGFQGGAGFLNFGQRFDGDISYATYNRRWPIYRSTASGTR